MSASNEGTSSTATGTPSRGRRFQTDVRTLIALIACCGLILWAWRYLAENADPVLREARAIQRRAIDAIGSSQKPAERVTAIHELERLHSSDISISIPPLIEALDDADIEVRLAAASALGTIGYGGVKSGSAGASLGSAATALARGAQDPNPRFRTAVAQNLGAIGASLVKSGSGGPPVTAAVMALTACLNDPEPGVRSAAVISLGKIDNTPWPAALTTPSFDRQALRDALARMLGDHDADVRFAVIRAMAVPPMMGGGPAQALVQATKDESPRNRAAAIRALSFARQGLDSWVPILFQLAEHDPDLSVREQCFSTLSYAFKPPAVTAAAVPNLITSLKRSDGHIRCQAAGILGVLGADAQTAIPELLRALNEPREPNAKPVPGPLANVDPAGEAAWALGQIAPGSTAEKLVIAALIEIVRSAPANRRGGAAGALGQFGAAAEEAVPVLIKVLKKGEADNKFEDASAVAMALGKIAPETSMADQAMAAILPVLESEGPYMRVGAILALERFGPRAAAAVAKIRALQDDRNRDVREAATKALPLIETAAGK